MHRNHQPPAEIKLDLVNPMRDGAQGPSSKANLSGWRNGRPIPTGTRNATNRELNALADVAARNRRVLDQPRLERPVILPFLAFDLAKPLWKLRGHMNG
jgi:hypothetical protein